MLEVSRAMRRERIFRNRINPLEVVLLDEYEKGKVILKANVQL
jgi:hypothetical protein